MTWIVEAKGLSVENRLARCDLNLRAGELTVLVGPNGAGKTTLLRALARIGGTAGTVAIDGQDLAKASPARRIDLLSFMSASRDMAWPLRAIDYVALALSGNEKSDRAAEALASLEASEFAERRTDTLSTGERTRIMLARALAPQSRVIVLDEPCANLDPQWRIAVIERLRAETRNGTAILLSSHDLDLAIEHGDRALVMNEGRIIADDAPQNALNSAILDQVFGVRKSESGHWDRT